MNEAEITTQLKISPRAEDFLEDVFRKLNEAQGPRDALPLLIAVFCVGYAEAMHKAAGYVRVGLSAMSREEQAMLEDLVMDSGINKLTSIAGKVFDLSEEEDGALQAES